jgi:hypothetical protein
MNEEAALIIRDDLVASDALLYGRKTFEVMAAAWPSRNDELGVAKRFNKLPKFVVSKTLSRGTTQKFYAARILMKRSRGSRVLIVAISSCGGAIILCRAWCREILLMSTGSMSIR